MFIYLIVLSVLVVIAYLVQFRAYCHYKNVDVGSEISELIKLPKKNVFDYELTEEEQLAAA